MSNKNLSFARAIGVDFFFTFTAGVPTIDQLTCTPEFSDDDINWYRDDSQTLTLSSGVGDLAGRSILHHVRVGSRQHKFARMSFASSTSQTTVSEISVSSRVTGIFSSPWTKDPQVAR
jgi:hypothetical protein